MVRGFLSIEQIMHGAVGENLGDIKHFGTEAFFGSDVRNIHVGDSVEEICEKCFSKCKIP